MSTELDQLRIGVSKSVYAGFLHYTIPQLNWDVTWNGETVASFRVWIEASRYAQRIARLSWTWWGEA